MDLITVLTTLSIVFSVLINQTPSVSSQQQHRHDLASSEAKLPRKLIPFEDTASLKGYENKESMQDTKLNGVLSAKVHSPAMQDGRKGTRQSWVDGHAWEYFTMDYAHVRRRRPIHNKSVPFTP